MTDPAEGTMRAMRDALQAAGLTSPDGTYVQGSTDAVLTALRSQGGSGEPVRCARCGSSGDVFMLCAGCHNPLRSPAESVVKPTDANISVLAEALYHCGCPAGGMTVGECAEQGVCGCSIRAERIKGCMGPDHQYFSRDAQQGAAE